MRRLRASMALGAIRGHQRALKAFRGIREHEGAIVRAIGRHQGAYQGASWGFKRNQGASAGIKDFREHQGTSIAIGRHQEVLGGITGIRRHQEASGKLGPSGRIKGHWILSEIIREHQRDSGGIKGH